MVGGKVRQPIGRRIGALVCRCDATAEARERVTITRQAYGKTYVATKVRQNVPCKFLV